MQPGTIKPIALSEKFALFTDQWNPRVIGELNDFFVKVVKLQGEFHWHHHEIEDELFFVVRGQLQMGLRDPDERNVVVNEGELLIVPAMVEHCPVVAGDEAWIMLIEPKTTVNTGTVVTERTRTDLKRI
jgi:mannose-6-phosphate isomerase-like protein (cupin superfamily)